MITIVYDSNPFRKELTTDWGFACVIQGLAKTILFDTGTDGRILLANMKKLDIDPETIDIVVLSHVHADHTGGLAAFLAARRGIPVWMPSGFGSAFKERVRSLGAEAREAPGSQIICEGARTTGTLGRGAIEEQGLCVETAGGWVVVTGCAHPGIANMAERAKEATGGPVYMVLGGFHMGGQPERKITAVIDRIEALGASCVAPCHCTGDAARGLFKERYGEHCTLAGVGSVFEFPVEQKPSAAP